jgi:hypothetical protein
VVSVSVRSRWSSQINSRIVSGASISILVTPS